jgi:hypothetical protein
LREKKLKLKNGLWSGSKGADLVLNSELANSFIIYTQASNELIKELRLKPDPKGGYSDGYSIVVKRDGERTSLN